MNEFEANRIFLFLEHCKTMQRKWIIFSCGLSQHRTVDDPPLTGVHQRLSAMLKWLISHATSQRRLAIIGSATSNVWRNATVPPTVTRAMLCHQIQLQRRDDVGLTLPWRPRRTRRFALFSHRRAISRCYLGRVMNIGTIPPPYRD